MIEDEAKTKWCPFAQLVSMAPTTGNRFLAADKTVADPTSGPVNCIGSECMAWRWIDFDVIADDAEAFQRAIDAERHGHCGLAGKP